MSTISLETSDERWAAWIARGAAHDGRVRRRFVRLAIAVAVIALGVALATLVML